MIQPALFCPSIAKLAESRGFTVQSLAAVSSHPILCLLRKAARITQPTFRLYLSSGVHGDEPAGPLAIEKVLNDDLLPYDIDITIIPLINPTGIEAQTRENAHGNDLNRDFHNPQNPETQAVKEFLATVPPFDLSLCLHEDWESAGFYLYHLSPDKDETLAREILQAVTETGPIDLASEIDGSPAARGLIQRNPESELAERDDWPEAFLLYSNSRHLHFTTESPSSAPIEQRINMHRTAILRAIKGARS